MICIIKAFHDASATNYVRMNTIAASAACFPLGEGARQLRMRGYSPYLN